MWKRTTLRSFQRLLAKPAVTHFGRFIEFLKQLQEQVRLVYQHKLYLRDRVLDAVHEEPHWADPVSRSLPDPDTLVDVIEPLLEARHASEPSPLFPAHAPSPRTMAPMLPAAPIFSAHLAAPSTPLPPLNDPFTGDTCVFTVDHDPSDHTAVY